MSLNTAVPLTVPVVKFGVETVGVPAIGVPASTPTVMVWVAVCTPLLAVMMNVSVVVAVAALRWPGFGV